MLSAAGYMSEVRFPFASGFNHGRKKKRTQKKEGTGICSKVIEVEQKSCLLSEKKQKQKDPLPSGMFQ